MSSAVTTSFPSNRLRSACLSSCGSGRWENRRDGVVELLVAPVLQQALPIGGGKGAFRFDLGVLVIDGVLDGGYIPPGHGAF